MVAVAGRSRLVVLAAALAALALPASPSRAADRTTSSRTPLGRRSPTR
jgi:hypothetical protein